MGVTPDSPGRHPEVISVNMLRLFTLGGLWLESDGSQRLAVPPRRLALLALLAAADRRGLSRDRAMALLWPEAEAERARHSLSQTLYSLRKDVGFPPVLETTDLRLDPDRISSDIGDLLVAVGAGDLPAVARLYAGPFLDGFHLSGSPEFEAWSEDLRASLREESLRAVEALATRTASAGQWVDAAALWQRLARQDPLNTRYTEQLMRALAASGDRAGALAAFRQHEARVRQALGGMADGSLVRLFEELRRGGQGESGEPPRQGRPVTGQASLRESLQESSAPASSPAPSRRLVLRSWWARAMVVGSLAVAALAAFQWKRPDAEVSPEQPVFAVGAIREPEGPDSAGRGVLTDMVATSLATVKGLRVLGTSRLIELMPREPENPTQALVEAARKAGATDLVEGELSWRDGGGFQLTLRRVDLTTGLVGSAVRAGGLDRFGAVDSATALLAAALGGATSPQAIAALTTASPVAYRFYEEGLRAFYQWDLAAAKRLMEAALEDDPGFAMAAYYAWWAETSLGDWGLERARQLRDMAASLPDRDRLLVLAHTGLTLNDPRGLAHADTLAVRYHGDPQALYVAGLVHLHAADFTGAERIIRQSIEHDQRSGSGTGTICRLCLSYRDLALSYLGRDQSAEAEQAARRWLALQPEDPAPRDFLASLFERQGRAEDVFRAWQATDSLRAEPFDHRLARARVLLSAGRYSEADADLAAPSRDYSHPIRAEALWLAVISLRNQGRYREAVALAGRSESPFLDPVLSYETGRFQRAADGYRALAAEAVRSFTDPHLRARNLAWRLTLAGTAHAAAGDTAVVRRLADSVQAIGAESLFGRDPRLHWFLRGLLQAASGDSAGAASAYRQSIASLADGYTRANLELGRMLLALGRPEDAIAALRPALQGGLDGSNLYVTRTELHELLAKAFDAAGRRDSAAAHYRAVMDAWSRADPMWLARRNAAASRLMALGGRR